MPSDDEIIRLRVPQSLKEKFRIYCALRGLTMSDVIREWIEETVKDVNLEKLLQERLKNED